MAKAGNPIDQIAIGEMLKAQRKRLGLTQNDISKRLEYGGYNFISMLESARSPLPLNRVVDIVKAYEFEDVFSLIFIKRAFPDVWGLFGALSGIMAASGMDFKQLDAEIDSRYKAALKESGLANLIKALG